MNFPTAYACGLFIGKLRMELGGKQTIVCKDTGLMAEIEFITKPFIGGDYNRLKGVIKDANGKKEFYEIEGKWDSRIMIKDKVSGKSEVFFDVPDTPIVKKYVSNIEDQGTWESRKLWHKVTAALKTNPPDHDTATVHKTELEDAQRERKKERDEKKLQYTTKHFSQDKDGLWTYNRINIKPYDPTEKSLAFDDIKVSHPQEDDDSGLPPGALSLSAKSSVSDAVAAMHPAGPKTSPAPRHQSVIDAPSSSAGAKPKKASSQDA